MAIPYERWVFWLRTAFLCLLFFLQFELVEVSLRNYFDRSGALASVWAPFFELRHFFFSFAIVFPAIVVLITWPRLRQHVDGLRRAQLHYPWLGKLVLELLAFSAFALLTYQLSTRPEFFASQQPLWFALWFCLVALTAGLALLALAPFVYWRTTGRRERHALVGALGGALLATGFSLWLQHVTPELARAALHGTHFLLSFFYNDLFYDVSHRVVGTRDFYVIVNNSCAGYEGISLITVFLSIYLWLFRSNFRFPQALLAFPVGITLMFLFNIVRISTLIFIGDRISPDIALAGFHSNAGWVAFLLVAIALLATLHRIPYLAGVTTEDTYGLNPKSSSLPTSEAEAMLAPAIALFAAMLLAGLWTVDFDYLYPLKVVAAAAVLWHYRQLYHWQHYRPSLTAPIVGIAVFLAWLLLVTPSAETTRVYSEQFSQWPLALTAGWLVIRVIGSAVTVPIVEELAFRGYLLARLGGNEPRIRGRLSFSIFALLASSTLFGLMHGDWIAGTLAGLMYAWLRYRSDHIGDAVLAHMCTNFLLCCYVLATQQWSYL